MLKSKNTSRRSISFLVSPKPGSSEGGGEFPHKKDGVARGKFWKEPPRDACFVGVAWNVLHPKEVSILSQQIISCQFFFSVQCPKRFHKAAAVAFLRLNNLRDTKPEFWTPKRHNE